RLPGCARESNTKPSRRDGHGAGVGLMEAIMESGKMRGAMKALVALQVQGDTQEAEAEHLLVEDKTDCDEEMAGRGGGPACSRRSRDAPPTRREEGSEYQK
ncbi:hypothetical protein FIBSPDRAFT_875376, partial [Athelia psychrophila]